MAPVLVPHRRTTKQIKHDVVSCLARKIHELNHPDYSSLRAEIEEHEYVSMRLTLGTYDEDTGREFRGPCWVKVLFVLQNCAIVQEVEMSASVYRFKTYKVMFGDEWTNKFHEWIDQGEHPRFHDVNAAWFDGMAMYGAQ